MPAWYYPFNLIELDIVFVKLVFYTSICGTCNGSDSVALSHASLTLFLVHSNENAPKMCDTLLLSKSKIIYAIPSKRIPSCKTSNRDVLSQNSDTHTIPFTPSMCYYLNIIRRLQWVESNKNYVFDLVHDKIWPVIILFKQRMLSNAGCTVYPVPNRFRCSSSWHQPLYRSHIYIIIIIK